MDENYNAAAYHLAQGMDDAHQQEIEKANRLIALRNRPDFVSRNRIVNGMVARQETEAETRDIPADRQVPGRMTTGATITQTPDILRDVLAGGMKPNPRSFITPSKSTAFTSPKAMIGVMAGSPSRQPQVRAAKKGMP
jgi:hypothetical protein